MQTITMFEVALPMREVDGTRYVAMRPLVEAHGLAWKPQFLKLKRRHGSVLKTLPFKAGDGKVRRMVGVPIGVAEGWLDSVNGSKVDALVRDKLDASKAADAAAKRAEAERLLIDVRCQRFGEAFRAAPLVRTERAYLEQSTGFGPLGAMLGYRFIAKQAYPELVLWQSLNEATVTMSKKLR